MNSSRVSMGRPGMLGLLPAAGFLIIMCAMSAAEASGRVQHITAGPMFRQILELKAGAAYEFSSSNLSPGTDTIIHVLEYPAGTFIAGNDDTILEDGSTSLASLVTVPAAPVARKVFVVVRGYSGTAAGTTDLTTVVFPSVGPILTMTRIGLQISPGHVQSVGTLAAGTHVTTVEESLGATDTLLLVVGGNAAIPLAFDDDDGIDRMSFLRLATACSFCQIVVGRATTVVARVGESPPPVPSPVGPETLVWDETIETPSADSDGDGLSNQLEQDTIGTLPNKRDTDDDGISDGFEVYGGLATVNGFTGQVPLGGTKNGNLLKFPRYGADPVNRDIFIERDWLPGCAGGPPGCSAATKDSTFQVPELWAQNMDSALAPDAFFVHQDIGRPNTDPATATIWNDWGGATRLSDAVTTFTGSGADLFIEVRDNHFCEGITPARWKFFHHFVTGNEPGSRYSHPCAATWPYHSVAIHEMGHGLALAHGGGVSFPDSSVNCKGNYASRMSYIHQNEGLDSAGNVIENAMAPGYSHNRFYATPLNGFFMNEAAGLSTTDPNVMNVLARNSGFPGSRGVDPATGGIDWNMDGRIEPPGQTIRAPAKWGNKDCGASFQRANWNLSRGQKPAFPVLTPAAARVASPTMTANGSSGFFPSGQPTVAVNVGNSSLCDSAGLNSCVRWGVTKGYPAPPGGGGRAPMSAGPLLLQVDNAGRLSSLRPGVPGGWTSVGGPPIEGDAVAVEVFGLVRVYGISGSQLRRWEYDIGRAMWTLIAGVPEVWEDGTLVFSRYGIGLSFGAQSDVPGISLYAAIPNAAGITATTAAPVEIARLESVPRDVVIPLPFGDIHFAYRDDHWIRNPNLVGHPVFHARPSLAYVPFADNDLEGRFFLGYLYAKDSTSGPTALMTFTEGNIVSLSPTARAFLWRDDVATRLQDSGRNPDFRSSGIQLGVFGRSLMAAGVSSASLHFFPAADGVFNYNLHDFNDVDLVQRNLSCSVRNVACSGQ